MSEFRFKLKKSLTSNHFDSSYCQNILMKIKNDKFTDIILLTENESCSVSAHRNILMAASGYFRAMLNNNWAEKDQEKITIKEIDGKTLQSLVDYCYTGQISITSETVWTVLKAASMLEFVGIEMECALFLDVQLRENPTECLNVYFVADMHSFKPLAKQAVSIAADLFSIISDTDIFLEIPFVALEAILKKNNQIDCQEEDIFRAALKWIKYDETTRKRFIPSILKTFRLTQMNVKFLLEVVKPICTQEICKELLFELLVSISVNAERIKVKNNDRVLLIVGRTQHYEDLYERKVIKIGYYTSNPKKWSLIRTINLKTELCRQATFVCSNTHLYIFDMCKDDLHKLISLKTFTVSSLPRMNEQRASVGAVFLNGLVYAIGGTNLALFEHSSSVECYNPYTGEWSNVSDLNIARVGIKTATLNDCIYAIGGYTKNGFSRICEYYDPAIDIWTIMPDLTPISTIEGVCVKDNKLYVLGYESRIRNNNNNINNILVQYFDPDAATWILAYAVDSPNQTLRIADLNNQIFRISKCVPPLSSYKSVLETLSENDESWTEVSTYMDSYDYIFAAPVLNKFINF